MLVNLNLSQLQMLQSNIVAQKQTFGCKKGLSADEFKHLVETCSEHNTLSQLNLDMQIAKEFHMSGLYKILEQAKDLKWDNAVSAFKNTLGNLKI